MRIQGLFALLALAACAPGGATSGPHFGPGSRRVLAADGRGADIGSGAEAFAAPQTIEAPFDRAWNAVLAAYGATELPLSGASRGSGRIEARFPVSRSMMGVPVSTFLTCGGGMGVAELADAYRVEVDVRIQLAPVGRGATEMRMQLRGSARDRFTTGDPRPCLTRGVLESRLAERARERLGIPTTAAGPVARKPLRSPGEDATGAGPPETEFPPVVDRAASTAPPLLLALGGAAGGALGTWLGSQVGQACERRCLNARGTLGPLVGNTVLIPLGAHLSNRGKGNLVPSFLSSAGWAALGVVVAGLTGEDWAVWAVTSGQVLTSALIEHDSARR